jgi:hypothetical protein
MRKVDQIYAKQEKLQKELEGLRENCPHTETYESLYSWRVGSYNPARLCTVCDEFIEYVEDSKVEKSEP